MSGDSISTADLSKAIDLVYAASLDPGRWSDLLHFLSQATDGVLTHIVGYDYRTGVNLGLVQANHEEEKIDEFRRYYVDLNPWLKARYSHETFEPYVTERFVPRSVLEKTEFYNDWIRPQGDIGAASGVTLFRDESRVFLLGGMMPFSKREKSEPRFLQLLKLLTPHTRNALEISRALRGERLKAVAIERAHDPLNAAVLALTEDAKFLFGNRRAEGLLEDGSVLRQDLAGRIGFRDRRAQLVFDRLCRDFAERERTIPPCFAVTDREGRIEYICRLCVFVASDDLDPFGGTGDVLQRAFLLTLVGTATEGDLGKILQRTYGFTASEALVALAISEGKRLSEIAEERGVSLHTVRSQLKAILGKAEVNRQVELVRLVERLRVFASLSPE